MKKKETKKLISSGGNRVKRTPDGKSSEKAKRLKKPKKWVIVLVSVLLALVCLYLIAVYSQIPFIKNLRTLYIETAMNTYTHKWLATAFIPKSVIDEVVKDMEKQLQDNMVEESQLPSGKPPVTNHVNPVTPPEQLQPDQPDMGLWELVELFYELDPDTVPKDLDCHDLQIKDIADMGIKTTAGDAVWAIDMPNGILIVEVEGSGYKGKLAIVRDSSKIVLAVNDRVDYGRTVTQFCQRNGAVLGINAGGFHDPEGVGRGNVPVGLVLSEGQIINGAVGSPYQICGYDYDHNLRLGYNVDLSELKYAVQFFPIVVLNGESALKGSTGMGIQPRTVVGQSSDKSSLFLIIDGRQPLHSLGTTLPECAAILLRYDCFNAMAMDGGSSASMTYMGEMITRTSSPAKAGRTLPNAWIVKGTYPGQDE